MHYDIVIIGGGAAGMCTAIKSKNQYNSVLLIEHKDRVGKKILSTGNGRCNFSNRFCKTAFWDHNPEGLPPYFPEKNKAFALAVIDRFDCDDTVSWLHSLGIQEEDKNGYLYPLSGQASSVLDLLRYTLMAKGAEVLTNTQPIRITKRKNRFLIDDDITCSKLVLACGGMAAPGTGSDGSGYEIASGFGHTIIKPLPALCGIRCEGSQYKAMFKAMQGVRSECRLRLFQDSFKHPRLTAFGNVQFNSYGVSGIPAMQLSSFIGRALDKKESWKLNIEFLPSISFPELVSVIDQRLKDLDQEAKRLLPAEMLLAGLLNKKIIAVMYKELGLNAKDSLADMLIKFCKSKHYQEGLVCGKKLDNLDDDRVFAARTAGLLKHFYVPVTGTCGFEEAQVTSGGVCVDEIDPETMQSRIVPGLYFVGEIMDIDGICGGYNLQWAWSTAHIAARSLTETT